MDQCEDREEEVPPSKTGLCGEHENQSEAQRIHQRLRPGPGPSCVSFKSDQSKDWIIDFSSPGAPPAPAERVDQQSSEVPSGQSAQQHQTQLDSIFMLLEDNIISFVKNELKKIHKLLSPDDPECLERQREDEEVLEGEDEKQRRSSREAFVKITVSFLRRMKQECCLPPPPEGVGERGDVTGVTFGHRTRVTPTPTGGGEPAGAKSREVSGNL